MTRALREHSRDVIAIIALILAGLFALFVILAGQRTSLPGWVPLLGSDRFELKAEFSAAQAVTPGQGQSVDIAGIRVGDVTGVDLEDGHALVTMQVDNKYAPLINSDAALLLRPKTGLNDMVVEVDPGTSSENVKQGSTIPLASTQPQVNPDEILSSLDADTQQFLKLLLGNGAEALDPAKNRGEKLSGALRRLDPFARDVARISGALAVRRENIRRSIHSFQLLSTELGNKDQDVTDFVDSSNAALASFARQEASIRAAIRELPAHPARDRGRADQRQSTGAQRGAGVARPDPRGPGDQARAAGARPLCSGRRRRRFATRSGHSPPRWRAPCTTSARLRCHSVRQCRGFAPASPGSTRVSTGSPTTPRATR